MVKKPEINEKKLEFYPGASSILERKMYFTVPLGSAGDEAGAGENERRYGPALERIKEEIARAKAPYTDIFVVSHGWHRNLFRAISAYDRLFYRLSVLFRRGAFGPPASGFNPLYLCLHWHSDFGQDSWLDLEGRRRRDAFLSQACEVFVPVAMAHSEMVRNLESFYHYATVASAPDVDPLDTQLVQQAEKIDDEFLGKLEIRDADRTTPEEKAVALWTCFFETPTQTVTDEQRDEAKPRQGMVQALVNLLSFLLRVLLPIGLLAGLLSRGAIRFLGVLWRDGLEVFSPRGALGWLGSAWERLGDSTYGAWLVSPIGQAVLWGAIGYLLAMLVLWRASQRNLRERRDYLLEKDRYERGARTDPPQRPQPRPLSFFKVALYLWAQIVHGLPLLAGALASYLTLRWIPVILAAAVGWELLRGTLSLRDLGNLSTYTLTFRWHIVLFILWLILNPLFRSVSDRLFDERFGKRGEPPRMDPGRALASPRLQACRFASIPGIWAHQADSPISRMFGLWDVIRSQLTIVDMQVKAVRSAAEASMFVEELLTADRESAAPKLQSARMHLIGHSFGGLLAINLAKYLAYGPLQKFKDVELRTVATLQGAYASDWFSGEDELLRKVEPTIACLYSKYDTATGAIYSAGLGARCGAGSVGLCYRPGDPATVAIHRPLPSATLSSPPDLVARIEQVEGDHVEVRVPTILNIDCSRFVFEGPVALGGGHDDIFKSDVIHTLWAVVNFQGNAPPPAPSGKGLDEPQDEISVKVRMVSPAKQDTDEVHIQNQA